MHSPCRWSWPAWIAHRGAGRLAPENTLAAFRLGAAHGWRAFECDVKLSADGVPYLLHDDTLDRTTDGQGPAAPWSWRDLSQLDAGRGGAPQWAGEPLLHLRGLARWLQAQGLAVNLELKPCPGQDAATGREVARAAAALWPAQDAPLLSSFSPAALAAARDAAPALPRALLLDRLDGDPLPAAAALGCEGLVLHHRLADAGLLARCRAAGLAVGVYTVNDGARAAELHALGVRSVISDAVDRLGPAAAR